MITLNENLREKILNDLLEEFMNAYPYEHKDTIKENLSINLDEWCRNKERLYDILKTHPDWNEEELCIITDAQVERPQNAMLAKDLSYILSNGSYVYKGKTPLASYRYAILNYFVANHFNYIKYDEGGNLIKPDEIHEHMVHNVEILQGTSYFNGWIDEQYKNEEGLDYFDKVIKAYSESTFGRDIAFALIADKMSLRIGQKYAKVLGALIKNLKLDGDYGLFDCHDYSYHLKDGVKVYHKDGTWHYDYFYQQTALYSLITDLIKPRKYTQKIYISINPVDYITQSHLFKDERYEDGRRGNYSCHSLRSHGCYHAGIVSMMNSPSCIIAYTLPENDSYATGNIHRDDKNSRCSLFVSDNLRAMFSNVFYPDKNWDVGMAVHGVLKPLLCNANGSNEEDYITDVGDYGYNYDDDKYYSYEDWNSKNTICTRLKDRHVGSDFYVIGGQFKLLSKSGWSADRDCYNDNFDDIMNMTEYPSEDEYYSTFYEDYVSPSRAVWCPDYDTWVDREDEDFHLCIDDNAWHHYDYCEYCASDEEYYHSTDYLYWCEYTGAYWLESDVIIDSDGEIMNNEYFDNHDYVICDNCGRFTNRYRVTANEEAFCMDCYEDWEEANSVEL